MMVNRLKHKKPVITKAVQLLFLFLTFFSSAFSQAFRSTADSKIVVTGTSTLHDWKMEAENFECVVHFVEGSGLGNQFHHAAFHLPYSELKNESKGLTDNAYKALKRMDITFESNELDRFETDGAMVKGVLRGNLSIAGVTKRIELPFEGRADGRERIVCDAQYQIDMLDYGIKPPTFMFGAMSTGNMVQVEIHLELQKQ